ncbi:hypothetical protein ACWCPS_03150 [Streptomyces mauvecolor]
MPFCLDNLVEDRASFFAAHWNSTPAVFEASDLPTEMLTEREITDMIDCGLLSHPYFSVIKDGKLVNPAATVRSRVVVGNRLNDLVDPDAARRAFCDGATLRLNQPDHWQESVHRLLEVFTEEFSAIVESYAFLAPAGSREQRKRPAGTHTFVIQLEGASEWTIGGRATPEVRRYGLAADTVLYIPQGMFCEVEVAEKSSLHLECTVIEPNAEETVRAISEAIIERIGKDPRSTSHHLLPTAEKTEWIRIAMGRFLGEPDLQDLIARAAALQARRR